MIYCYYNLARFGRAGLGAAWLGLDWLGMAGQGLVNRCLIVPVLYLMVGFGWARLGEAGSIYSYDLIER